jgi:NarL family two-component system sensor histidine kinase LiaS
MNQRRVTLAQELHDGIAQDLVGLGYSIDSLIASTQDVKSKDSLRTVRFTITALIEKVRQEIHQLRSASDLLSENTNNDLHFELHRVISEIFRNISEHSSASHLTLEISDNGVGGAQKKEGSFGLIGIQERITRLNGDIHIDSSQQGTKIRIEIPLVR